MTSTRDEGSPRHVRVLFGLAVPPGASVDVGAAGEPLHVRLVINDVSLADAAAVPVAETDVVVIGGEGLQGPYTLLVDLEPGRQFAVSAHVDRSGDGNLAPGDLINTVRVPVPSHLDTVNVEVPLVEVR